MALDARPVAPVEWIAGHLLTVARMHRTRLESLRERARVSRSIALLTGPHMATLRSRALARRIRRTGPLDAVVQLGTAYGLPDGLRIATYEDMTVRQALALPYPEWTSLSRREQAAALARQARAYQRAAACCFTTDWAAASAREDYGVPLSNVHVVGIGRNHSPRPVDRDWTTPRFLFVGTDWKRKNGDAVVRAFARLRDELPAARLDLVGGHPRLEADGVVGHGTLSLGDDDGRAELRHLLETATCFVMPSWCEPSAISYVEAAAAGVPSIGSSVGGSAELIGEGGCVVDPADVEGLLDAMRRLADGGAARAAGERARTRSESFTWPLVASRILSALGLEPASPT